MVQLLLLKFMHFGASFLCGLLLFILVFPYSGWCEQINNSSCLTAQCHNNMALGNNIHPDKAECTSCHQAQGRPHPDKTVANFSVESGTCITCHTEIIDYDYLHSPVAAGDCTSCHLAHGIKGTKLLYEQETITCYNCHNSVIESNDTVMHGEVSENKCGSCHTVHGSFFPNLLRGQYSVSFFNDFNPEQYELCFKCHKSDILLHPRTSYNTKFRDGKRNLHYLHVNKKSKGRSCKSCHEIHSGTEPHLLARSVNFGNWQMPVNFQPTENGGRCSPGCHAPTDYDRKKRK